MIGAAGRLISLMTPSTRAAPKSTKNNKKALPNGKFGAVLDSDDLPYDSSYSLPSSSSSSIARY